MRLILMLIPLVVIVVLVVDLFFLPVGFVWLGQPLMPGVLLLVMVSILLFLIYAWQQAQAVSRQMEQRGMTPLVQRELFRSDITPSRRPYIRETRLPYIVLLGIAVIYIVTPAVVLLLKYTVSPFEKQVAIGRILSHVYLLSLSALFIVYTLLSKNFSEGPSSEEPS